ncbi:2-oxoglutarate receptor 1-like [Anguilla anguilla]|uniref:2-oxoglutarate receptor 1-like n=1 Tax=Anguilla anguilla TaxID=7936 RepID=UPI0015A86514|nr:2-oxoglutarate receptor 1-like [Anguilla anguilla]XP_035249634.1 2-oxoglutarate receptor 1-like [Anguilla anguilla]
MASKDLPKDSCMQLDETLQRTFLPVMYGIIFIVGFLGNITCIFVYVTKMRPWKSSSMVMLNLAVTDLMYVLSLPFLVLHYSRPDVLPLDNFLCYVVRVAFHFHLYASILFLTCISAFRYVAVVHPLRSARLQQRKWGVASCLAVWGLSALEMHPMLDTITLDLNGTRICPDFASSRSEKLVLYNWLLTVLGYLLPLVAVVLCYVRVARALSAGPYPRTPSRARARRMSVAVLAVFAVNFTPYHALRMLRVYTRDSQNCTLREGANAAYILFRPLAAFNACLNLPLYTLAGGRLHQALCGLLPRELSNRLRLASPR